MRIRVGLVRIRGRIGLLAVLGVLSALGLGATSAQALQAAPFKVTKTADTLDASCAPTNCSLRDAIAASDAAPGPNTITLPAGDYKLSRPHTSGLLVNKSVTINGAGAGSTTIDAQGGGRIFDIQGGADFAVRGVKLTGGVAPGPGTADGGAVWVENGGAISFTSSILTGNRAVGTAGYGGAIEIESAGAPVSMTTTTFTANRAGGGGITGSGGAIANLTGMPISLSQVTMSDNHAGGGSSGYGFGGAIDSSGAVNASYSTLAGNSAGGGGDATGNGGAIHSSSSVSLTASSVAGNTAGGSSGYGFGGGISADGTVTLSASTVSHNSAGGGSSMSGSGGGGIFTGDTVNATNSTIAANSSGGGVNYGFGGGIDVSNPASLQNDTIVGNRALVVSSAGGGGGVSGPLTSSGSIIADNASASGTNCDTLATSNGNNLENGTSCGFTGTGDLNSEPMLRGLANNGGLGQTLAPMPNSPAVDHGPPPTGCPSTDERGVVRPQGAACEIGAYELARPAAQTGASRIQRNGRVSLAASATNPDVVAGRLFVQWGRTTGYGSQTSTIPVAGRSSASLSGLITSHLKPGALYHYRAVASNPDGTALGADRVFRAPMAPVLSHLKVHGRAVSYRDSQAAHTTLTLQVRRRHRWLRVGRIKHHDRSGTNHLRLPKVSGGSYRLIAVARLAFEPQSRAATASFKVR